jgi:hypothetical protein
VIIFKKLKINKMAQKTKDQIIDELIEKTQKRKAEIEKAEKPSWQTNCLFGYDNSNVGKTNLRVVSNINEIVSMLAFILQKQNSFVQANNMLGTKEKFDWLGFSLEEWQSDLRTRIEQITVTAKKKELAEIETQLDGLISKERREELQLAAIMKRLENN